MLGCMDDTHLVVCPYCGEELEIYVEADVRGSYVQDVPALKLELKVGLFGVPHSDCRKLVLLGPSEGAGS